MQQPGIIGNGMAGVACLENILAPKQKFEITINGLDWYRKNGIGLRLGSRILDVNTKIRTLTSDDGSVTRYDKLIFATGLSAFIPPMDGICRRNVFTFRNLDDTHGMLRVAAPGKRAVVIGGGLLGLEAARGLQLCGCELTVIHLVDRLMNNRLDSTAGGFLKRRMEELGIPALTGRTTTAILGPDEAHRSRAARSLCACFLAEAEAVEFTDAEKTAACRRRRRFQATRGSNAGSRSTPPSSCR
ncbi:MAG: FAD-dependent oxidoreductase [Terriglobia bacterium]